MGTSVEPASAEPEQWKRASAYRMHGERVDGNDVLAVLRGLRPAAAPARDGARAVAARDDDLPLPRPLGGRRRARSTARRRRSPRRASTTRSTASWRSRASSAEAVNAPPHGGQRRDRRGHPRGGRRPGARSGEALRQRLRRPGLARAVLADGPRRPVRRAGGHALVAGVTYREALRRALDEELARDERVFLMGEEIGRFEGSYKVTAGPLREVRPEARARDADRRGGLRRRRHRRGDARPAAGRRDHDDQLHPGGHGHGREPRGQDAPDVRRQGRRADGDPHAGRRRRAAHGAALAEPRGHVRRTRRA